MTTHARIRSFADRIERLDEEIKALNNDKKEIYAEMKGEGFDTKAFKAAHRRHLAHEQNSVTAQEGEALTDLYFVALQGAEGSESPPAAKFGAANGLPEKPSRARAREQSEPQPVDASRPVESSGGWTVSADAPAAPIQDLPKVSPALPTSASEAAGDPTPPAADYSMPELPAFLDRRKHTVAA